MRATHEATACETAAREVVEREAVEIDEMNRAAAQATLQQPGVFVLTGGALVSGSTTVPLAKDAKLDFRVFIGKELHKGVGGGFKHWGRALREELEGLRGVRLRVAREVYNRQALLVSPRRG
uniref:Uncharacterized protein n=1 Tax=Peronospora matthiolae TaxID=2874970 RepID=A0AAV1U6D0_9STRA